jgi:hypothetical protein
MKNHSERKVFQFEISVEEVVRILYKHGYLKELLLAKKATVLPDDGRLVGARIFGSVWDGPLLQVSIESDILDDRFLNQGNSFMRIDFAWMDRK